MSSQTLVEMGGTQNKAWAESLMIPIVIIFRCSQIIRNEDDEDDGMD